MPVNIRSVLHELSQELRDLDLGYEVTRVPAHQLTPLSFHREYVARNKPVIVTGAIDAWPAMHRWSTQYMADKMGPAEITVAATPSGRADSVAQLGEAEVFGLPAELRMSVGALFRSLQDGSGGNVLYAQAQNNSMPEEFGPLMEDIAELPWATEAFGEPPEATNLWIGGKRSITSFHKDPYENMYAVVRGTKTFTLLPPADAYRLHMQQYPVARYQQRGEGRLQLVREEPEQDVPWSPVDPYPIAEQLEASRAAFPEYWNPHLPRPLQAAVGEGEVLFLPSLWYHHVRQHAGSAEAVIAVNFWYDMAWDCKAAYATCMQALGQLV